MVLDVERQQLLRSPVRQGLASGGEGSTITPLGGLAERITSMTTVGDTVVWLTDDGVVVFEVATPTPPPRCGVTVEVGEPGLAVLAQPAPEGSPDRRRAARRHGRPDRPGKRPGGRRRNGAVVDLAGDRRRRTGGADRPRRMHVRRRHRPADAHPHCDGVADQTTALDGADPGAELRLRLVNGWIWINDVDTGAAWVTGPTSRSDRVEDWGNILSDDGDDADEDRQTTTASRHRGQPGRRRRDVQRPTRSTRTGQRAARRPRRQGPDPGRPASDVDVLANDTDPNGDVLVVTEIDRRPGRGTR